MGDDARPTILAYRGDQLAAVLVRGAPPVYHGAAGARVRALVEADGLRYNPWQLEVRDSGLHHDSADWFLASALLGRGLARAGFRVLSFGEPVNRPRWRRAARPPACAPPRTAPRPRGAGGAKVRATGVRRQFAEGCLALPEARPAAVSQRAWTVLVRHVRDRVSYTALAAELGVSPHTARQLAAQAAAALRHPELADLPGVARRALVLGGYTTREAVAQASDADLLGLKRMSPARLRDVRRVIPRALLGREGATKAIVLHDGWLAAAFEHGQTPRYRWPGGEQVRAVVEATGCDVVGGTLAEWQAALARVGAALTHAGCFVVPGRGDDA